MDALKGRRILVLEDEAHIGKLLFEMLLNLGCQIVGPVTDITAAIVAIKENPLDAAILDVKVAGQDTRGVADELIRREIPFAFVSGNQTSASIKRYAPARMITKPYSEERIREILCELIQSLP